MPDLELVEPDFVNTAKKVVRVERIIDASAATLWSIVTDTPTWSEWFPTMTRAESVSPRATLGSTRTVKVGALVAEERIIVSDEPERWAFTVTRTNLPIAQRLLEQLEFEDVPTDRARTRVLYTGAIDPPWFVAPAFGILRKNIATTWRHGLDGLAKRATSSASS